MISHPTLTVDPGAKALIFDVDGTLLDTMPIHRQAWKEALEQYFVPFSDDLFAELAGLTTANIVEFLNERFCARLDAPLDVAVISAAKDRAYLNRVPLIQPIGPVLDLLHRYRDRMPLGAATNETFGLAHMVLRSTGMAPLFQALVTADEVDRPKPAPDIYLECADRLGVLPADCQVFEDSEYGLQAATAAGMITTDVRAVL